MKRIASLVLGLCLVTTGSWADELEFPTITPGSKNVPFVDTNLYLMTLKCTLPKFDPNARVHSVFGDENRLVVFTVTISNSSVGANLAPSASSVLAAIPVAAQTISDTAMNPFTNDNCGQSFLITGRTPVYLTVLYTDQDNYAESPGLQFVTALASTILPLGVFFPTGAANLLKQDVTAQTGMAAAFQTALSTKNYSITYTRTTKPLQQGYYLIRTPKGYAGSVDISIDRATSLQTVLNKSQPIRDAFETALQTFQSQVTTGIASNPTICYTIGQALEYNQNLSHADAVHSLAQVVAPSGISSVQASNCLGTAYGPEVRDDPWFKQHSNLHLANFPEIKNPVPFSLRVYTQLTAAMTNYAVAKKSNVKPDTANLDKWFLPQITLTDTTGIFGASAKMSIEQILDKLLAAKAQYVAYGCGDKDGTTADDSGLLATGYLLGIGQAANPDDLVLLRTWWQYDSGTSNQAHISEVDIGSDPAIQQALKDYGNECAYHVKVNTPPAAGH